MRTLDDAVAGHIISLMGHLFGDMNALSDLAPHGVMGVVRQLLAGTDSFEYGGAGGLISLRGLLGDMMRGLFHGMGATQGFAFQDFPCLFDGL